MKVLITILIGLLVVGCGKKIEDHVEEVGGGSKYTEFETVTAMAMSGFPDKQFKLGWMYANGEGVEKDYKEAVKWYRKAAENGYAYAQNALGDMYVNGKGTEQNFEEALKWYREAAGKGDGEAMTSLAHMYEQGKGVERDIVTAYAWQIIVTRRGDFLSGESAQRKSDLADKLTPDEIAKAKTLADEMQNLRMLKGDPGLPSINTK